MSNNSNLASLARTSAYIAPARIQSITASVASSALTCTLNPTVLDFRSATLTSGAVNSRIVPTAISLVVPSTATLGTVSATQSRLIVIALDNAGTVELAITNLSGGLNLNETVLISTTALTAGSTAANVVYSTTARTNVPFRVVGFVESTQATAGTWATAPSTIQGAGGEAISGMSSIGFGQTWQTVTRNGGVTYYNTTGRPIALTQNISSSASTSAYSSQVSINGASLIFVAYTGGATYANPGTMGSVLIPAGASYVFTYTNVSTVTSYELR